DFSVLSKGYTLTSICIITKGRIRALTATRPLMFILLLSSTSPGAIRGDTHMSRTQPDGYLAMPCAGKGPGVLVLHAWWGLNDTMKAFCTRLAEEGFVAFAPDLYHGKVADNIADAETLGQALDTNHLQAKAEIADATRFLDERVEQ